MLVGFAPFEISFTRSAVRAGILFFLADSAVAGLLRLSRSYGRCASNIELAGRRFTQVSRKCDINLDKRED